MLRIRTPDSRKLFLNELPHQWGSLSPHQLDGGTPLNAHGIEPLSALPSSKFHKITLYVSKHLQTFRLGYTPSLDPAQKSERFVPYPPLFESRVRFKQTRFLLASTDSRQMNGIGAFPGPSRSVCGILPSINPSHLFNVKPRNNSKACS